MQLSRLGFRNWAIAVYLMTTNLKGESSMKLHRDLEITQKFAWLMTHKIRETFDDLTCPFNGTVEADKIYVGGKEKNIHKKLIAAQGIVGNTANIGVTSRESYQITVTSIASTGAEAIQRCINETSADDAQIYTNSATACDEVREKRETVNHRIGGNVRDMAQTNGIESFWALMKRGFYGKFHRGISIKHLPRYVNEFSGTHKIRSKDTLV